MKTTILKLLPMFALGIFLCGCHSDAYYQHQAVERARDFILEEQPQMPLLEQEYIKFNQPFILAEQIHGGYRTGIAQICICWITPDSPDICMVYGTSSVRMNDWQPQRIIRKNFKQADGQFLKTAAAASEELIQRQFSLLSPDSVNHIRFTLPGLWKCKFPLNSNPGSNYTNQQLAEANKLPRYVLAWEIKENGKTIYAVYGGTARNDHLTGFKAYFSGLYTAEDFAANLTAPKPLIAPYGGIAK